MNLKTILQNPEAAISEIWLSSEACPFHSEIVSLVCKINSRKKELKRARTAKQEIASKFKLAKGNAGLLEELKGEMQKISTHLNSLENEQKELEKELLSYFSAQSRTTASPFPERFVISTRNLKTAAPEMIEVRLADSGDSWDTYVNANANASAYHAYAWKKIIEKSFGHACPYLIAKISNEIVGVLPLVKFSSRIFGSFAVSVPYFNYGGPLGNSPEVLSALIDHAESLRETNNWQHVEYRCSINSLNLPCESRKASMILALPETFSDLENALGAKVRAQYKQTERVHPAIHFGGLELLDEFYEVFAHNMRDLGTPVYSKNFFQNILGEFSKQTTLVVAYIAGEPMATAFLFGFRDMLEIPWASTLRKANQYNLNMWMYKNILNFAINKKYSYFDFGRSTIDAGTFKFKKQWGAEPLKHYWYYSMNKDEELPQLNPDNAKYKFAIGIWKKLPVALTKLIGPPLVKNIP